jgi:hypothetical protein
VGSKDEATFRINIDGNAASASKEISSSAREAARSITEYETEVKALSADLRRLKGSSSDVVAAKAALKAKIDAAKSAASSLTAELVKQGSSYKAAAEAAKKYGDGVGKLPNLRNAIAKGLSPVAKKLGDVFGPAAKAMGTKLAPVTKAISAKLAPITAKFSAVGKAAKEDLGSVLPSVSSMLGLVASGSAIAAAAVVAVGVAFVGAAAALASFVLGASDSYAKMNRQREALLGTAKDAGNLGDQIGLLASKTPKSVAELNSLAHSLNKTRISGKATVDALGAIAQVSGAVDDAAGAKIQELITRNDKFGRMAIGAFELDGTGLDFDEVAKAYADGTKKSIDAARKELRMGVAPIEAGSKALKDAAEKKFGKVNIANAFSLENAPKKFFDQFNILASGVNLEPISKALQEAFGQLSPDKPLGAALKEFFTVFGGGMVEVGAKAIPLVLEGFKYMIGFGLKLTALFINTKNAIADALDGDSFLEKAKGVGLAIMTGWAKGLYLGYSTLYEAIRNVGADAIKAFKALLGIKSPSKVFAKFGEYTTEGYAQGVERGSKRASGAVQDMVGMPSVSTTNNTTSGGAVSVVVNINGASTDSAKAMQSPEFMASLSRALTDSLNSAGVAA